MDSRTAKALAFLYAAHISPRMEPVYRLAIQRARIEDGNRVLDFGCGDGALLSLVRREFPGCQLWGVDRWPELLAYAEARRLPDCYLRLGGIECIAETAPLDVIMATNVTYSMSSKEREAFLGMALSALGPGGRMVLVDPDGAAGPEAMLEAAGMHDPAFAMMMLKAYADARAAGWCARAAETLLLAAGRAADTEVVSCDHLGDMVVVTVGA